MTPAQRYKGNDVSDKPDSCGFNLSFQLKMKAAGHSETLVFFIQDICFSQTQFITQNYAFGNMFRL